VKIKEKNARRTIEDGEIRSACQQTCPTGAIVFGDLNDEKSQVKKLQSGPRSYAMLEELNVRPRLQYLARVKNPNPELS
jgi:Fe-S-cluster-containing dehydrogenase component